MNPLNAEKVFTVSELNHTVKQVLESMPFLNRIWVEGEISNYTEYSSGHHYFSVKDSESALKCVMFRQSARHLTFKPERGMHVMLFGDISAYVRDGVYQFIVSDMRPLGTGNLREQFEAMKRKLEAEGLFDESHKVPIPRYPDRIAVITSPDGAAVHDVIRILKKRWPLSEVIIVPVHVQGRDAAREMSDALALANRLNLGDVIILGRGGGSEEDLWPFNEECLARAIFDSEIPVISAVGHEPDVLISDYVADRRASTPSNAAEVAVPDCKQFMQYFDGAQKRLYSRFESYIAEKSLLLSGLRNSSCFAETSKVIIRHKSKMELLSSELNSSFDILINAKKREVNNLCLSLDALSPLKVLTRGYAIVENDTGGFVKSAGALSKGENVKVTFKDGFLQCTVDDVLLIEG